MKRTVKILISLLLFALNSYAQPTTVQRAMKPTIMVMPEKAWCINNGYAKDNGLQADYERAMLNDDILNAVTKMGGLMEERGYPLKLLSSTLDELKNEEALDLALTSKNNGEVVEDDLDRLLRVAQADIVVNIAFDRKSFGPRNLMEFRVTSIDAATSKQIGGEVGSSSASGAPMSVLLEESVLNFIDNFSASIQRHFQNTIEQGREGTIIFKIASDCPLNFESDVTLNGEMGELNEVIDYWMNENTVNSAFSSNSKSKVRLMYEQVRFPLFGKGKFGGRQKALNAEGFIKSIGTFLAQFGLSISVTPIGIGKAYVMIGAK